MLMHSLIASPITVTSNMHNSFLEPITKENIPPWLHRGDHSFSF